MSENLNPGARDFSKYDTMATADLEEILRLDAESPEGTESDTELLLYVMGVLADRRRNNGNAGKTALEAWESFEKNYMPEEEVLSEASAEKTGVRFAPWLRKAVAAAAVIALLVSLPFTAEAFGLGDLWDVFARWAKETFSFVSGEDTELTEPVPPGEEGFASLQDALVKSNRDPSIVPTWIPDGYMLYDVVKNISPIRESYSAFYTNEDRSFKIIVHSFIDTDSSRLEIDTSSMDMYVYNNIEFYFFKNMDEHQVIWILDSYECSITGDVSIDDMKLMIESIERK